MQHTIDIRGKSGLGKEELHRLIAKVFEQLTLVPDRSLKPFLPAAASLVKDPKDWLYFSCALYEDTLIWSNDNDFGGQKRVTVVTTKELITLVGLL